ncbi:MAG: transcriptional regulator GcvA [Deltaproteobacteria bacterium]|nr:transcriptional regulator GcvA [Deltaproteobacteria bacterium]
MFNQLPSLSALQTFEAAARHGSFTAAARELHVTQGAVSHQIRALEDDLGYRLFTRLARRVELTEEGQILGEAMTRGLGRIAEALRQIETQLGRSWLTVSVSHSFAVRWLVPRLEDYRRLHPQTDVRISSTNRMLDPRREGIDLCIRFGEGDYPGLDSQLLITEDVFPVCSPQLLEGKHPLTSPAALPHHVLLHDDVLIDHPLRASWEHWLELAGVEHDGPRGPHLSHTSMTMTAAVAGQGVALGRTCLVENDLGEGRLVRPFGPSFKSPFSYWLVTRRGGFDRKPVAAFVAWLRASMP